MRKSFNILKFAPSRAEEYAYGRLASRSAEIYADGGIIQRPDYVYEWLKLCFELGRIAGLSTPLQIRRKYNALAGVKLNNVAGTDFVSTMYDWGTNDTHARVNAVQETAANQPAYSTNALVPSGIFVPTYDGSRRLLIADRAMAQNATAFTALATFADSDPNGAITDTAHDIVNIARNDNVSGIRVRMRSRGVGSNVFSSSARRLDAETLITVNSAISNATLNSSCIECVFGGGLFVYYVNGSQIGTGNFSGSGPSSSTASAVDPSIGDRGDGATGFRGIIPDIVLGRIAMTAAQQAAFLQLEKAYYPTLP